jgi:hypothetical protein
MSTNDYTIAFTVDQSPDAVFEAINHVRGWWSGDVVGEPSDLGAEFTYNVEGVHFTRQKVTEFVAGKKAVWHVAEANISFAHDPREWAGTDIVFEIARRGEQTELRFTHRGLIASLECYDNCSNAWSALVGGNLRNLISTGKDQPSPW